MGKDQILTMLATQKNNKKKNCSCLLIISQKNIIENSNLQKYPFTIINKN